MLITLDNERCRLYQLFKNSEKKIQSLQQELQKKDNAYIKLEEKYESERSKLTLKNKEYTTMSAQFTTIQKEANLLKKELYSNQSRFKLPNRSSSSLNSKLTISMKRNSVSKLSENTKGSSYMNINNINTLRELLTEKDSIICQLTENKDITSPDSNSLAQNSSTNEINTNFSEKNIVIPSDKTTHQFRKANECGGATNTERYIATVH